MLAFAGFIEPSLVFTVGTNTLLTDGAGAANHLKATACAIAAVEAGDDACSMAAFADAGINPAAVANVAGINYTNGDRLEVMLYRLPAS